MIDVHLDDLDVLYEPFCDEISCLQHGRHAYGWRVCAPHGNYSKSVRVDEIRLIDTQRTRLYHNLLFLIPVIYYHQNSPTAKK